MVKEGNQFWTKGRIIGFSSEKSGIKVASTPLSHLLIKEYQGR